MKPILNVRKERTTLEDTAGAKLSIHCRPQLPVMNGDGMEGCALRGPGGLPCQPPPPPAHPSPACLLGVFDEQPADEVLGQLAGVAEVFLVEVIVHSRDVGQGLLLGLTQERGGAAQAGRRTQASASPVPAP